MELPQPFGSSVTNAAEMVFAIGIVVESTFRNVPPPPGTGSVACSLAKYTYAFLPAANISPVGAPVTFRADTSAI
ncbi:hypothetical protein SLS54_009740 [Diplodia seriata]